MVKIKIGGDGLIEIGAVILRSFSNFILPDSMASGSLIVSIDQKYCADWNSVFLK